MPKKLLQKHMFEEFEIFSAKILAEDAKRNA